MRRLFTLFFYVLMAIGLYAQTREIDLRFYPTRIYDYFDNNQPNCIITDGTNVDALAKMLGTETLVLSDKEYKKYNLSNYNIICIGTSETNEFIDTLKLPYSYDGKEFVIGDTIMNAKDYNFMAVSNNPYCISNALLHIGEITEGYNNMFFKNAQFVVFSRDSVIHKGEYYSHLTNLLNSPNAKTYSAKIYPSTQLRKMPKLDNTNISFDTSAFSVLKSKEDIKNVVSGISNRKVIFLGENHYFNAINSIVKKIVFELNRESHFPYLVIEKPYSHTELINKFLDISNDKDASNYFISKLDMIVTCVEDSIFFNEIRKWNRDNHERKIQVLCTDIEHDYAATIEEILIPKLNDLDIDIHEDSLYSVSYLRSLINNEKIIEANNSQLYPLVDNLIQTFMAYNSLSKGFRHFNKIRQKAIISKYVEPHYFKSIIRDNKFIVYGGSEHTGTRNKNYLSHDSEGYYLEYINPYTNGLTYSIRLVAFSYTIDHATLSKKNFKFRPSGYLSMLNQFKKALENNSVNATDTVFIFNNYDSFTKRLLEVSSSLNSPFHFTSGNINKFERLNYVSFQDMKQSVFHRNHYLKFDKVIVIPTSKLITSR